MWLLHRCNGSVHCERALSLLTRRYFNAGVTRLPDYSYPNHRLDKVCITGISQCSGILSSSLCSRHFSSGKRDDGNSDEDVESQSDTNDTTEPVQSFESMLQGHPSIVVEFITGKKFGKNRMGRNAGGTKIRRLPIPIKEDSVGTLSSDSSFGMNTLNTFSKGDSDNSSVEPTGSSEPEGTGNGNNDGTADAVVSEEDTLKDISEDPVYDGAKDVESGSSSIQSGEDHSDGKPADGSSDDVIAPAHIKLPILHFHTTTRLHALPALAMFQKPAFPGFYQVLHIQNPAVLQCLSSIKQSSGNEYVGGFLTKTVHSRDLHNPGLPVLRDDAGAVHSYEEMHRHGTLLQIITITPHVSHQGGQVILMPYRRIKMTGIHAEPTDSYPLFRVSIDYVEDDPKSFEDSRVTKALHLEIIATVKELIKTSNFYKEHFDHIIRIYNLDNPSRIADLIAGISMAKRDQLQAILAEVNLDKRLAMVLEVARTDLEFAKVQAEVKTQIEEKMSREQRKYILTEQMKMIRKELGLDHDDKGGLMEQFESEFSRVESHMSKEAKDSFKSSLSRLRQLEASSAEFGVCRSHLEWLLGLPWGTYTKDSSDILNAQKVLDKHHFGLKDVKTRLMEYMATSILKGNASGKIICLCGPPGVGKTSIATAIAELLNRKLYRFSLGGLFDVAELRGHRRTYVGALPGKFVQALKYTGSMNPLIVLDEIDKLGRDARGDPASALLEVLDPSQNEYFRDYYLDIPVDLSRVLFICTANAVDTIPGPLIDRMEIINIPGYLPEEKLEIAKNYLVPQTLKSTGLTSDVISLPDETIRAIVEHYSREAGVRTLLRCIEKIYRKVALSIVMDNAGKVSDAGSTLTVAVSSETSSDNCGLLTGVDPVVISSDKLQGYLGVPTYTKDSLHPYPLPYGVVMGLAWTNAGGATMYVEARGQMVDKRGNLVEPDRDSIPLSPDTQVDEVQSSDVENRFGTFHGTLKVTGHLGNVMTESSQIALTFCKTFIRKHQPRNLFLDEAHIHIHVPEGATPKDGPSGGITMASALVSLAARKRLKPRLAMTGELTLSGKVLRVGGIKEKLIAAIREGVTTVVLPKSNEPDVCELEESIVSRLSIIYVDNYDDVYDAVFEH